MPECAIQPYEREALDLVRQRFDSEAWGKVARMEEVMEELPQERTPLNHIFTPGINGTYLYCREIFMAAGQLVISRIHLTEHPFVISMGRVSVWTDEEGWVTYNAPHTGVTRPGTRRILYIHEDTIWSTFHVTDKTNPDEIVLDVTFSKGKYASLGAAAAAPLLTEKGTQ